MKPILTIKTLEDVSAYMMSDWSISDKYSVPLEVNRKLYPQQRRGIEFIFKNYLKGQGCIVDHDAGMGKSVATCVFLEAVLPAQKNPALIICDKALMPQWHYHLDQWTQLSAGRLRNEADVDHVLLNDHNVIIIDTKLLGMLPKQFWPVIIVDHSEGLNIAALKKYFMQPNSFRLILTNIQARDPAKRQTLWSMLSFVNPDCVGTKKSFTSACNCDLEHLLWAPWSKSYQRLNWTAYKRYKPLIDREEFLKQMTKWETHLSSYQRKRVKTETTPPPAKKKRRSSILWDCTQANNAETEPSSDSEENHYFIIVADNHYYSPQCYALKQNLNCDGPTRVLPTGASIGDTIETSSDQESNSIRSVQTISGTPGSPLQCRVETNLSQLTQFDPLDASISSDEDIKLRLESSDEVLNTSNDWETSFNTLLTSAKKKTASISSTPSQSMTTRQTPKPQAVNTGSNDTENFFSTPIQTQNFLQGMAIEVTSPANVTRPVNESRTVKIQRGTASLVVQKSNTKCNDWESVFSALTSPRKIPRGKSKEATAHGNQSLVESIIADAKSETTEKLGLDSTTESSDWENVFDALTQPRKKQQDKPKEIASSESSVVGNFSRTVLERDTESNDWGNDFSTVIQTQKMIRDKSTEITSPAKITRSIDESRTVEIERGTVSRMVQESDTKCNDWENVFTTLTSPRKIPRSKSKETTAHGNRSVVESIIAEDKLGSTEKLALDITTESSDWENVFDALTQPRKKQQGKPKEIASSVSVNRAVVGNVSKTVLERDTESNDWENVFTTLTQPRKREQVKSEKSTTPASGSVKKIARTDDDCFDSIFNKLILK